MCPGIKDEGKLFSPASIVVSKSPLKNWRLQGGFSHLCLFVETVRNCWKNKDNLGRIIKSKSKEDVMPQAYCMKCRQKREIKDSKQITMKNNRPAVQGTCPVCGTKVFRIGKL